ncbi:hypothetical protein VP01_230g6 [Puccinia sorghi]|uniref:Uncharacterized protein n=1 Tax=Puccinia sorghi TaxID=27349 RepID=A0A0L6V7S9_9BASI|nr:hypothetical protein VP01_230g6 [Puccinia sorghi]
MLNLSGGIKDFFIVFFCVFFLTFYHLHFFMASFPFPPCFSLIDSIFLNILLPPNYFFFMVVTVSKDRKDIKMGIRAKKKKSGNPYHQGIILSTLLSSAIVYILDIFCLKHVACWLHVTHIYAAKIKLNYCGKLSNMMCIIIGSTKLPALGGQSSQHQLGKLSYTDFNEQTKSGKYAGLHAADPAISLLRAIKHFHNECPLSSTARQKLSHLRQPSWVKWKVRLCHGLLSEELKAIPYTFFFSNPCPNQPGPSEHVCPLNPGSFDSCKKRAKLPTCKNFKAFIIHPSGYLAYIVAPNRKKYHTTRNSISLSIKYAAYEASLQAGAFSNTGGSTPNKGPAMGYPLCQLLLLAVQRASLEQSLADRQALAADCQALAADRHATHDHCGVFIGEAVAAAEADQSKQRKVSSGLFSAEKINFCFLQAGSKRGGLVLGSSRHQRRIGRMRVVPEGASGENRAGGVPGGPEEGSSYISTLSSAYIISSVVVYFPSKLYSPQSSSTPLSRNSHTSDNPLILLYIPCMCIHSNRNKLLRTQTGDTLKKKKTLGAASFVPGKSILCPYISVPHLHRCEIWRLTGLIGGELMHESKLPSKLHMFACICFWHSHCAVCTVTVHQSLVESSLENGLSKKRSFLGLSACQLQAVEQVSFAVLCVFCYLSFVVMNSQHESDPHTYMSQFLLVF